jgi:hypothetical protein
MYPHSLAIGTGKVWFNGHFTHMPELIGSVDHATGRVSTYRVPSHPRLGRGPGGPIPYEIRVGPDGRIWGSELQGNRLFAFTPAAETFEVFTLPTSHSGPRRFDVDPNGIVWIPAYGFDPAGRRFTEIRLPIRDAVPYIVRAEPSTGALLCRAEAASSGTLPLTHAPVQCGLPLEPCLAFPPVSPACSGGEPARLPCLVRLLRSSSAPGRTATRALSYGVPDVPHGN